MGVYDTIASAKPQGNNRGVYLEAGNHNLEIHMLKHVTSWVGAKEFFVAELIMNEPDEASSHKKGQLCTWMCHLNGAFPDTAMGDVKSFLMSATGAEEEDIDETFVLECLGPVEGQEGTEGTLLQGRPIAVTVVEKTTKKGGTFSKHYFKAVE